MDDPVEEFERRRGRLFGLAYRMLGSAHDAEDVVQDAYLRWNGVDHDSIEHPTAWLDKAVTNLCLTRLTSARSRREQYVGPWLPEPISTDRLDTAPEEQVELDESISVATLHLLERLTPTERAVFVLRTAFGHSHADIATVLEISEVNSRHLYRRSSDRIDAAPRFALDRDHHRRLLEQFLNAAREGDVAGLEQLLADDVVSYADGGGVAQAARRPVLGRDRVSRYLGQGLPRFSAAYDFELDVVELNGRAGLVARSSAGTTLATVTIDVRDGRIATIHIVANPHKLSFLERQLANESHPG